MTQASDLLPVLPWPFRDGTFPRPLGAVVMDSVLEGRMPALQVVHFASGHWGIADGVDEPDERNCTLTHIWHVLDQDESLHGLASLAPGCQADRTQPGGEWMISPHQPGKPYRLRDRLVFAIDIIRFGEDEAEKRRADRFRFGDDGPG
jgi:hypothetical protein